MKKRFVVDSLEAKVTKFGTGAHVVVPVQHVGKEAFVHVLQPKKKAGSEEMFVVTDGKNVRLVSDPRHKLVDEKERRRIEKEWDEFPDDGYFKEE